MQVTDAIDTQERIDKCRKILADDPNSQIFAALAEAHRRRGELDKAFRICQDGLKTHSEYGAAHAVMARINLDRRMYDWAETEARKAAELDGWTRSTELLLAEIHIYKGEFGPAIKLLNQLHDSAPSNEQISKLLEIARQIPEQQAAALRESQASSEVADVSSIGDSGPIEEVAVPPEPASKLTIEDVLDQSINVPGVDGVLFVGREGLLVSARWAIDGRTEEYAATMTEIAGILDRELAVQTWGPVTTVLLESDGRTFYLVRRGNGMIVFVVGDAANLGGLKMRLESLLVRLS